VTWLGRQNVHQAFIPPPEMIETVTDDADLEEVYNTERHFAVRRLNPYRESLIVTGVEQSSNSRMIYGS
jgi:hypothetical protein